MEFNEGRRVLRVQPNSDIKSRLKGRFRSNKQKFQQTEPSTIDQVRKCVEEFASFDGSIENSAVFNNLLELLISSDKVLLANDQLLEPVFLKIPLLLCSDDQRIRTAVFHLLRLLLINEGRLILYLDMLVDQFAVRSLDILLLPKIERSEALRILAIMLKFHATLKVKPTYPEYTSFPTSAIKAIHAVAVHRLVITESGESDCKLDEINKAALGILLEMSILDPLLVLEKCSTDWIPRVLVSPGINNPQICALVCRVLSSWLEDPIIREKAALQLVIEQIFAPLIDLGFFHQVDPKMKGSQKVPQTLECCANIFLNLMCTWSGFFACSSTEQLMGNVVSPLKFLSYLGQVKSVGCNLEKIREIVIDVCCDFVCMPYAGKKFTRWEDTLLFYSKIHQSDTYESSLRDGFIVGEMNSALYYESENTDYVDFLVSFRALAAFVLINFGLVESLIRLILSVPNDSIGLKATLLLGDLLRTSVKFVPKDWKQLLLSTPALIQLMTQNLVSSDVEKHGILERNQMLPDSENSILLLHRLEEIYTISQTRPSFLSQLKHANLFVLPSKAGHDRPRGVKIHEDDSELDGQCSDAISKFIEQDKQMWTSFEFIIQRFRNLPSLFNRWQHNEKCHSFFVRVTEFFAPKNEVFLKEPVTHEIVKQGSLAFRLIVRLAESEPYYNEMLEKYVTDFCRELTDNVVYNGIFCPRNIIHTNVYLYFAITAAIGSKSYGHWMLEKSGFYQLCLDLITRNTPIEYVKLILSSLNYNTKSEITRVILETGLTTASEPARKWITQFLEVLLVLKVLPDFEDYGMRLLFQQLADPSGKVVRTAVRILNKWLPAFPKSLKQMKNVRLETLGDSGILLDVHLHSNEECVRLDLERTRSTLKYWTETFNNNYVEIVEDEMRLALANYKRSMSGRFARISTQRKPIQSVRAPAHICGALAGHQMGLELIECEGTLKSLLNIIRQPVTKESCLSVKAALLALGHFIGSISEENGRQILPPDVIELICEFAEKSQYLSLRGIAFFALNLAAQSKYGVMELTKLGWESNRHINVQERLSVQFQSHKLSDVNNVNVDEFRSCRSNSLYTRAGNEALTALRQHRANQSRRRTTSSCVSQSRASECTEDDPLELNEVELEELEFDIEMYKVLNDPKIKLGDILTRKAIKKNRISALNKDSNSRLLQRDFLTYVKGVSTFDKFGFLSDSETSELMEYRNLLQIPESSHSRPIKSIQINRNALEKSLIQNSVGNNWTICTIPREMQMISENIFNIQPSLTSSTSKQQSISKAAPINQSTNQHNQQKCLYCLVKGGKLTSSFTEYFYRIELTEQQIFDYDQRREDILLSITMLEVREQIYQTRLANHYRACTAFQHPCIYADALELLNDLSYSLETRSFIQQLFWECMTKSL